MYDKQSMGWGTFGRTALTIAMTGLFFMGCTVTQERYHPQYQSHFQGMKTLLVVPPEVSIIEQMADGSLVWQEKESHTAEILAQQAMTRSLIKKLFKAKALDPGTIAQPEVKSLRSLFRVVNRAIQLHTYGPQLYSSKRQSFEYSLGPVVDLLQSHDAQGLVLAIGHQVLSEKRPKSWLSIAVVDPTGDILWYSMWGAKENLHLKSVEGMATAVERTLSTLRELET